MRITTTIIALILLLTALVAQAADEVGTLEDFYLSLAAPQGWDQAGPEAIPHRLRGTLLAGWQKNTPSGPAVIYLVGVRRSGPFSFTDADGSFRDYLTEKKVQFSRDTKFAIAGRDAVKFSFTAAGTGKIISALSSSASGSTSTYMEIIIIANGWADGKGTDLIHFVFACPAAVKDDARGAFKSLLTVSSLKGKRGAGSAGDEEEGGEEEDGLGALVASGLVIPGQAPILTPGPYMPKDPAPAPPTGGLPAGTKFLNAVVAGATALWVTPQLQPADWYVLVWPAKQQAYILSKDEYSKLAVPTEGLMVVTAGDSLQPHLNRWEKLFPDKAAAAPAAPATQ